MTRKFPAYARIMLLLCVVMLLGTAVAQDTSPTETAEAPTPVAPTVETSPEPATDVPTAEPDILTLEPTATSGEILGIPTPNVPLETLIPSVDNGLGRFNLDSEQPPVAPEAIQDRDSRLGYDLTKLDSGLQNVIASYAIGDTLGTESAARNYYLPKDEKGRFLVTVTAAEGNNGKQVVNAIEAAGGKVMQRAGRIVFAKLNEGQIALLSGDARVGLIVPQTTGRADAEPTSIMRNPAGDVSSEAFDVANALEWHTTGYTGGGVNIAILDFGFGDVANVAGNTNLSCIYNYPTVTLSRGALTTNDTRRGLDMAEIVCDIAPSATVHLHKVTTPNDLRDAITAAAVGNKIIIIGAEYGANVSPGDGTSGMATDTNTLYGAIAAAKASGVTIVAAAGNANKAYTAFNYNGTSTFLEDIGAKPGDTINISWNDWDKLPSNSGAREDVGMSLSGSGFTTIVKPARGAGTPSYQFTVPATCATVGGFCQNLDLSFNSLSGNTSIVTVQVSVGGGLDRTIGTLSVAPLSSVGTISRPADSPHVIAVGAVCADFTFNFPQKDYSATGPIYGVGGAPAANVSQLTAVDVKPDVVGPDSVSVFMNQLQPRPDPLSTLCDSSIGGFRGTQAAAAHVGAMTALLLNNPLVTGFTGPAAPTNIMHYMRTHSIDLPLTYEAGGYDNEYGAGLPSLGQPTFDYDASLAAPIFAAPNNLPIGECGTDTIYVGPRNTGENIITGTAEYPYQSIMQAVNLQNVSPGGGRCVIVLPGEYPTPFFFDGLSNDIGIYGYSGVMLDASIQPTTLVVQNRYWGSSILINSPRSAGVYLLEGFDTTIGGFNFHGGKTLKDATFYQPQLLAVDSVDNFTLLRSKVNGVTSNNTLIEIFGNSLNATISDNRFTNNVGRAGAGLIAVYDSGAVNQEVTIISNHFENNRYNEGDWAIEVSLSIDWSSMIRTLDSYVDIVSNTMRSNVAESLVQGVTRLQDAPFVVRILGNAMINNTLSSADLFSPGPLIHAFFQRYMLVVNNTIAETKFIASGEPFNTLIARGDLNNDIFPFPCNDCGSMSETLARWDLRGNLFMNNQSSAIVRDVNTFLSSGAQCVANGLDGTVSANHQTGATHNWLFNSGNGGDCGSSFGQPANSNIFLDPTLLLLGGDVTTLEYYLPVRPIDPDPNLIDDGPDSFVSAALPEFHAGMDANGQVRSSGPIDIGAYEYTPFEIPNAINSFSSEDGGVVQLNLATYITGGFAPYTAQIMVHPAYYGTQCSDRFASPALQGTIIDAVDPNTLVAMYCPPRHFHTDSSQIPSNIVPLIIEVRDATGAGNQTQLNYIIGQVNDSPLTTSMTTNAIAATGRAAPINTVRLRPYVSFGNNFFFSETDNPIAAHRTQVDYNFTYTQPVLVADPENTINAGSIVLTGLNPVTGEIGIDSQSLLTEEKGKFQYTVTDRNGHSVTNYVFISVIAPPDPFNLLAPNDNAYINNLGKLNTLTWEVSGNADSYDVTVFPNIPGVLTPTIQVTGLVSGSGGLLCTTTCVYTIPPVEKQKLTSGDYVWNVDADNNSLKASAENGPRRFTIQIGRELIVNGSFEAQLGSKPKKPANWGFVTLTGDKRKCGDGVGGSCYFEFSANPSTQALINQSPAPVGRANDTLVFSAAIRTTNLSANTGILQAVIKYSNGDKEKLRITALSGTNEFTTFTTASLQLTQPVATYKIKLQMKTGKGKMAVDDVSLVLDEAIPFRLLSPWNNTVIANNSYITELKWESSGSSPTYQVYLSHAGTPLINSIFTADADADGLVCGQSVCVMQLPAGILAYDGAYSWSVTASNGTLASNAPFGFNLMLGATELVLNGGFEERTNANKTKIWKTAGLQSSAVVCESGTLHPEYQGACAFRFSGAGGLNATLKQTLDKTNILPGGQLTLRAAAQLAKSVPGADIKLQITYMNGIKEARRIIFPASSTEWQTYAADPVFLTSAVKAVKLTVSYKGASGKVTVDNISVIYQPPMP